MKTFCHTCLTSCMQEWAALCFEEVVLEDQPALTGFPFTFHSSLPCDSTKKIPELAEFCSPEVPPCNCTICLSHFSQNFNLHNLLAALYILYLFFARSPEDSSVTCIKKLPSTQTRNLDCLCPAVLPYLQISGWFSSPVSTSGD